MFQINFDKFTGKNSPKVLEVWKKKFHEIIWKTWEIFRKFRKIMTPCLDIYFRKSKFSVFLYFSLDNYTYSKFHHYVFRDSLKFFSDHLIFLLKFFYDFIKIFTKWWGVWQLDEWTVRGWIRIGCPTGVRFEINLIYRGLTPFIMPRVSRGDPRKFTASLPWPWLAVGGVRTWLYSAIEAVFNKHT